MSEQQEWQEQETPGIDNIKSEKLEKLKNLLEAKSQKKKPLDFKTLNFYTKNKTKNKGNNFKTECEKELQEKERIGTNSDIGEEKTSEVFEQQELPKNLRLSSRQKTKIFGLNIF